MAWRRIASLLLATSPATLVAGVGDPGIDCSIPGEPLHWIADACMARLGTDDEIAASDCIAKEARVPFTSGCETKVHYKRELCTWSVERGTHAGPVDACLADPGFAGATVRNGGVGR